MQTTRSRNERQDFSTDLKEIVKIMKECCGHLYANLDEVDKSLGKYKQPKLTQEEKKSLQKHCFRLFIDFRERGVGRETSICCFIYLCINWLLLVCALTPQLWHVGVII